MSVAAVAREPAGATVLRGVGLHRRYGRRVALHDLTIHVDAGEVVGLIGPNGAGKTTAFRLLAGLLRPHLGRVELDGRDVGAWPLWRRARAGLGYLPQQATVFRRLTVAQNVDVALARRGLERGARAQARDELIGWMGLAALADARGDTLSGGERRRVEILRALAAEPRALLVDEPFAGLDPRATAQVAEALRRLAGRGVGVLVTDHDARQTLEACDRIYILADGELLLSGTPAEVVADRRAREAYLGEGLTRALDAAREPREDSPTDGE